MVTYTIVGVGEEWELDVRQVHRCEFCGRKVISKYDKEGRSCESCAGGEYVIVGYYHEVITRDFIGGGNESASFSEVQGVLDEFQELLQVLQRDGWEISSWGSKGSVFLRKGCISKRDVRE